MIERQHELPRMLSGLITRGIKIPECFRDRGRWMDNVFIERLWRSVKYEDVYLKAYDSVGEVRQGLKTYFEFYNHRRWHQSLDPECFRGCCLLQYAASEVDGGMNRQLITYKSLLSVLTNPATSIYLTDGWPIICSSLSDTYEASCKYCHKISFLPHCPSVGNKGHHRCLQIA